MSRDLILLIVLPFIFDTIEHRSQTTNVSFCILAFRFSTVQSFQVYFQTSPVRQEEDRRMGGKGMEAVGIYPPPSPPAVDGKQRVENGRSAWHTT